MARLKYQEIMNSNRKELLSKLRELHTELLKVSAQKATKSLSNPARPKEIRKSVARILTAINSKERTRNVEKKESKNGAKKVKIVREENSREGKEKIKIRKEIIRGKVQSQ